jgi:hypothetical protein
MLSADLLRQEWRERARLRPLHPVMDLTEEGLVLGAGTVLAERRTNIAGAPELMLDGAQERILALLAIAYGKAVDPRVLGNIYRASTEWGRGESVLARIHLAHSGLPRLPDEGDAPFRLFVAERVLAAGMTPHDLLKACGLDTGPLDLLKAGYNPDEPRVPAGNPDGGRWTSEGAEPKAPAPHLPGGGFEPVNYKPGKYRIVPEKPSDAVVVRSPDGKPITAGNPPTTLIAPPHANFHTVYAAGRAIAGLPLSEQYPRARAAIAHGGTYDFQRDVPQQKLYRSYIPAANYAVGVYMAGAGYSLRATLILTRIYSIEDSNQIITQEAEDWITRGWNDAHSGWWK